VGICVNYNEVKISLNSTGQQKLVTKSLAENLSFVKHIETKDAQNFETLINEIQRFDATLNLWKG
jgi:hypothetical protein